MPAAEFQLSDWRQRIFDIYRQVRAVARTDPAEAFALWHRERSKLYYEHPMSPVSPDKRARFSDIAAFTYDPALRFIIKVEKQHGEGVIYELGSDGQLGVEPFAITKGLIDALGAELTLYRLAGYGGGVFLPFKDATSGKSTYGGGRYLLDTIKGADLGTDFGGKLVIDFNFAYSPSCAWSPQYVCPLAPEENIFSMPIEAGEKTPEASFVSVA
ncbi:MAG: DUF1684 domain-containing protein [Pseudomonadota bacterium]